MPGKILAEGQLNKMRIAPVVDGDVRYFLEFCDDSVCMNELLGKNIQLHWAGKIHCSHCGRATKKSFSQGYCYPCFTKLAQCDSCMMSPEKCHFAQGTCREPEWAEQVCFSDHIVYLANSSGLKVGITRHTQVPTRWLDQGAAQALPIARVKNRRLSGLVEDLLRQQVADKTNWRALLKSDAVALDLETERDRLFDLFADELADIEQREGPGSIELLSNSERVEFRYPVSEYPSKISSHNFDKNPDVQGTLKGLKGQYLILDTGVINLRKFTSYQVSLAVMD